MSIEHRTPVWRCDGCSFTEEAPPKYDDSLPPDGWLRVEINTRPGSVQEREHYDACSTYCAATIIETRTVKGVPNKRRGQCRYCIAQPGRACDSDSHRRYTRRSDVGADR